MTNSLRILSLVCCVLLLSTLDAISQDSSSNSQITSYLPGKLIQNVHAKTTDITERLTMHTEKYLRRIAKQEAFLQKKLALKDSAAATRIFGQVASEYKT